MFVAIFVSQICATWVLEVIAAACADLGHESGEETKNLKKSIFPDENYKSDAQRRKFNDEDVDIKDSPYYIRLKLEYSVISKHFVGEWAKNLAIVILVAILYGAMCLKYVAGAESFEQFVSQIAFDSQCGWRREWLGDFDPYYMGLIFFGVFSLAFSFGDLENSKFL
jgi:hypothetical protein